MKDPKYARAERVAGLARDALRRLAEFERERPDMMGWRTGLAQAARQDVLAKADAWSVTPTSVTVSAWPYGAEVDAEAARRAYGAVADAAEYARKWAGLIGAATVEASGPFSVLIKWAEAEQ